VTRVSETHTSSPQSKCSFFGYTHADLVDVLSPGYRATQLYEAVYKQDLDDLDRITNLPKGFRADIKSRLDISLPPIHRTFEADDGTRRHLVQLDDGEMAETVYIPDGDRNTICVSSQVGCALACGFCLTGQMGFTRHLGAAEIVAQVMLIRRLDIETGFKDHFNVVLMGMGEPLHNYDNVMQALRILHDPAGLNMSMSRITMSTVGLLPELERLAEEPLIPNIAISMTGATDRKRDRWMPINQTYPIRDIVAALRRLPVRPRKRIMIEYVLLKDETDTLDDALALARIAMSIDTKVNLIPLNESPDLGFKRPDHDTVLRFQAVLREHGIPTFIRKSRGDEISAACGQLKKKWADQPVQIDVEALRLEQVTRDE
jgi:23S rRNA (adenine2503-C2)-methyltransferase